MALSTSAKPNAPTSAGDEPEAANQIGDAEGEAGMRNGRPTGLTIASSRPRKPASHPFSGSPPVRLPEITTPNTASQRNS